MESEYSTNLADGKHTTFQSHINFAPESKTVFSKDIKKINYKPFESDFSQTRDRLGIGNNKGLKISDGFYEKVNLFYQYDLAKTDYLDDKNDQELKNKYKEIRERYDSKIKLANWYAIFLLDELKKKNNGKENPGFATKLLDLYTTYYEPESIKQSKINTQTADQLFKILNNAPSRE